MKKWTLPTKSDHALPFCPWFCWQVKSEITFPSTILDLTHPCVLKDLRGLKRSNLSEGQSLCDPGKLKLPCQDSLECMIWGLYMMRTMHRKWETLCNIWCCSFLYQWQYSVINFVKIPLTFLCDHFTLDNQRKFMSFPSKYCFFLFQIYPFTTQFFPPYLHVPCFLVPLCFCNHQVFYSLSKSLTLHKHSENYNVALDIEIEKRMAKKFSKRLTKRLTRLQIKRFSKKMTIKLKKEGLNKQVD